MESFAVRPKLTKRGTPRSVPMVSARVAHTSAQKRRLDLYVTAPVMRELGWTEGGRVDVAFDIAAAGFLVRLTPAHNGLRATRANARSPTVRVVVSGAPLVKGLCAKVRPVTYRTAGGVLVADLPREWAGDIEPAATAAEAS